MIQQFFSVLGEKAKPIIDNLTPSNKKIVKEMLLNPIMPSNSLELEQVLSFILDSEKSKNSDDIPEESDLDKERSQKEISLDQSKDISKSNSDNSADKRETEDPKIKERTLYQKKAKYIEQQNVQLAALFISSLENEEADKLKSYLDKNFILALSKVNIDELPAHENVCKIINDKLNSISI